MTSVNRQKRPRSSSGSSERDAQPPTIRVSALEQLLKKTVQNIDKNINEIDYFFRKKDGTRGNNIVSIPKNFGGTRKWFNQAGLDFRSLKDEHFKVDSIIRLTLAYKLQQDIFLCNKKNDIDDLKNNECDLVMINTMEEIIKDFTEHNIKIEDDFANQLENLKKELSLKKSFSFLDAINLVGSPSLSEKMCSKKINPVKHNLDIQELKNIVSKHSLAKENLHIPISSDTISDSLEFGGNPTFIQNNIFINIQPQMQTTFVPEYPDPDKAGTSNNPEQFTASQDEAEFYEWLKSHDLSEQN